MASAAKGGFFILAAVLAIAANCPTAQAVWPFDKKSDKPPAEPTLFIAPAEPNSKNALRFDDVSRAWPGSRNIVVATHGWIEREPWPMDLAILIKDKVDANEWVCGWFDWKEQARVVNPTDAAKYARDTAGPKLAKQILQVSKNPRHVHLIGHSAGCWAISEAAKIIAKQTNTSIHLTFLDAYVPPGWDANELGNIAVEPNQLCWADQYLTQDITLKVTDRILAHAHNVDIGDITPGIKNHRFPFHWYPATVLGKYDQKDKYAGKKLYCTSGDIEYGFARCLEAGDENWSKSLTLPCGGAAMKIEKPTE
jgi:hypothetical protein